ncbi:hypothetical protein GCM10023165_03590 [Variovorax defluvii]|uniref:PilZ domain-containing protein n=1 Tax=Variovorax defluvii TaxID=913761 RepID=A0ABP8GUI0_9BURK
MHKITAARPADTTTRKRARLVFRAADERRPFHRGDLALHEGSVVLVCMSERDAGPELPVRTMHGVNRSARVKHLQLLAGVDTQEFGPGFHELAHFIAEAG